MDVLQNTVFLGAVQSIVAAKALLVVALPGLVPATDSTICIALLVFMGALSSVLRYLTGHDVGPVLKENYGRKYLRYLSYIKMIVNYSA